MSPQSALSWVRQFFLSAPPPYSVIRVLPCCLCSALLAFLVPRRSPVVSVQYITLKPTPGVPFPPRQKGLHFDSNLIL